MAEYHVNHNGNWHTVDVHPASHRGSGSGGGGANGFGFLIVPFVVVIFLAAIFDGKSKDKASDLPAATYEVERPQFLGSRANTVAAPASQADLARLDVGVRRGFISSAGAISKENAPKWTFDFGETGKRPDKLYRLVDSSGVVRYTVTLGSVGVRYGPFVAPHGTKFRVEFSEFSGCSVFVPQTRHGGQAHEMKGGYFFTEEDAQSFFVTPLAPNVSFVLQSRN